MARRRSNEDGDFDYRLPRERAIPADAQRLIDAHNARIALENMERFRPDAGFSETARRAIDAYTARTAREAMKRLREEP